MIVSLNGWPLPGGCWLTQVPGGVSSRFLSAPAIGAAAVG
jgi:hypothetical protein